jgi:quinol-cytochrome oxidoreductase complex cytochrome b subunit
MNKVAILLIIFSLFFIVINVVGYLQGGSTSSVVGIACSIFSIYFFIEFLVGNTKRDIDK